MKYFHLLILLISTNNCFSQQDSASLSISKEVLSDFTHNILLAKKNNQYIASELYAVFSKMGNGDYLSIQMEIENIATKKENQKILFDYLYDKNTSASTDYTRYDMLFYFLFDKLAMSVQNARILAKYINALGFLSEWEKQKKYEEENKLINDRTKIQESTETSDSTMKEKKLNHLRYQSRSGNERVMEEEPQNLIKLIQGNEVFTDNDLSSCAEFIGNKSDLITYYKKAVDNRFIIPMIVNTDGSISYLHDRRYPQSGNLDTVMLSNILKFSPAKKVILEDNYAVRSEITFSFTERKTTELFTIEAIAKKKGNAIKIVSENLPDELKIINDVLNINQALSNKKNGIYNIKLKKLNSVVDIFFNGMQAKKCFSPIIKSAEITKFNVQFYGDGQYWYYVQ